MILVDSNAPMYLVGAAHPNKTASRRILEKLVLEGERLVTDAEVLQEILRRYVAIHRRDAIQPAFDALLGVVDEVLPVTGPDVKRAREILLESNRISARDALHAAIMSAHSIDRILTFDQAFDDVPGVSRVTWP